MAQEMTNTDIMINTIAKNLRDGKYDESFKVVGEGFTITENLIIERTVNGSIVEKRLVMAPGTDKETAFRGRYVRRLVKACETKAAGKSQARAKVQLDEEAVAELMDLI